MAFSYVIFSSSMSSSLNEASSLVMSRNLSWLWTGLLMTESLGHSSRNSYLLWRHPAHARTLQQQRSTARQPTIKTRISLAVVLDLVSISLHPSSWHPHPDIVHMVMTFTCKIQIVQVSIERFSRDRHMPSNLIALYEVSRHCIPIRSWMIKRWAII